MPLSLIQSLLSHRIDDDVADVVLDYFFIEFHIRKRKSGQGRFGYKFKHQYGTILDSIG